MAFNTIVKARHNKDFQRLTSVWRKREYRHNIEENATTLVKFINAKGSIEAFRYAIALNQLTFLLYVSYFYIWKNNNLNDPNRVFKFIRRNYFLDNRSSLYLIHLLSDKLDSMSYVIEGMRVEEDSVRGRDSDSYIRIKIYKNSEAHKKVILNNLRKIPEIRLTYNSEFTDYYGKKYHEYFVDLNVKYIANKLYKRKIKELVDLLLNK